MVSLVRGVFDRCENVFVFQKRILSQDLLVRCTCGKQFEDVSITNSESPQAGPAPAFSFLNSNPFQAFIIHQGIVYPCLKAISRLDPGFTRASCRVAVKPRRMSSLRLKLRENSRTPSS